MDDLTARAEAARRREAGDTRQRLVSPIAHGDELILADEADVLRTDEWTPQAVDGERWIVSDCAVDVEGVR